MMSHDVTVIMPCYNAGPFIKTAIESVLQQNVPVQLLVVNDGSTDNTMEVLAGFGSALQIFDTVNQGVAHARNTAVDHVRGRFTLLLDADDALVPDSLAALVGRISRESQSVVYGDFSSWDMAMQKKLHLHQTARLGGSPLALLARRNISPPGAILFPSDAFARVGRFDQAVAGCEDWDFVIRLARAGYRFNRHSREVFRYRRLPASASNQVLKMHRSGLEVVRRCHFNDPRVVNDNYPQGYEQHRLDLNMFLYHLASLGLAALDPAPDNFRQIIAEARPPAGVNWTEAVATFRQSLWWNSLAVQGEHYRVMEEASSRAMQLFKEQARQYGWCQDMVTVMLKPDLMQLLRRPGPKKALRLFREWQMARRAYRNG